MARIDRLLGIAAGALLPACLPAFSSQSNLDGSPGPEGSAASSSLSAVSSDAAADASSDAAADAPSQGCASAGSVCDSPGNVCADGGTVASCEQDGQGCYVVASMTPCTGGTVCLNGTCACGGATPDECGSTCTDTASDGANCGGCGHSCLGAACSNGLCQPFSIASASSPFQLTTDGVNVYYLSNGPGANGEVSSVPIGGGFGSGPFSAPDMVTIVTDGQYVYWGGQTQYGTALLYFAPVANLGTSQIVAQGQADPVQVMAVDLVYQDLIVALGCDVFVTFPLATANATSSSAGGPDGCPNAIVGNKSLFYWSNPASLDFLGTAQTNSSPAVFASSSSFDPIAVSVSAQGLALSGDYVYFTDSAGSKVARVPADASSAAVGIASASSPLGLVVDSTYVYWIDDGGADVKRVPLAGGNVTTIATNQTASAIAQYGAVGASGASLYWTNTNGIMRLAK